jgi:hypothetical protein
MVPSVGPAAVPTLFRVMRSEPFGCASGLLASCVNVVVAIRSHGRSESVHVPPDLVPGWIPVSVVASVPLVSGLRNRRRLLAAAAAQRGRYPGTGVGTTLEVVLPLTLPLGRAASHEARQARRVAGL